jgi:hypothetical protein
MIEKKSATGCADHDYCAGWNDAVDAMPRWISVEERLPEHDVFVLVGYNRYDHVFEGCYLEDEKYWCDREYSYIAPPSHWMPLPEPPKEE